jgi:hypothetical protein
VVSGTAWISGGVVSGGVVRGGVVRGGVVSGTAWISGGVVSDGEVSGGVVSGTDIEYIISHLQYLITINLTCSSAQIGCHYKTLADWLNVSLDEAKKMGLKEKNYKHIRNLLEKFI